MIKIKAGDMSGYITVSKGTCTERMEPCAEFPNAILDAGLNEFIKGTSFMNYCNIGTSSTPVLTTQTTLGSKLRHSNTVANADVTGANADNPSEQYVFRRRTIRFAPTGSPYNIAEIGFGWDTTGSLFNRALVVDALGQPTQISVLANEYIDITYELRLYPPIQDITGTLTPSGKDTAQRTWICRSGGGGSGLSYSPSFWALSGGLTSTVNTSVFYSGSIGALFSYPAGTGSYGSYIYVTKGERVGEAIFSCPASLGQANLALGIKSCRVSSERGVSLQFQFDPPFMKTDRDEFTFSFSYIFGRR